MFLFREFFEMFIQIVTIAETPFIYVRPDNRCDPETEILCPRKRLNGISKKFFVLIESTSFSIDSGNDEYENFCCFGYCIDLLKELSKNLTFVYTLHLVGDNKYGAYEKVISVMMKYN